MAYMEETGRLDLTLEVSAMYSPSLSSAAVLNMALPIDSIAHDAAASLLLSLSQLLEQPLPW